MEYARGTWIDPEERKARAICPDGKARIVCIGAPDTFFSIPGRCKAAGKTVTGYVTIAHDDSCDAWAEFLPYLYRKNHGAFGK